MEKKAHGGFAMMNKLGQVIVGTGNYDESGKFVKQPADSLTIRPAEAIVDEMIEKGFWGSYMVSEVLSENVIEPEKMI